jgi:hypothetical protein
VAQVVSEVRVPLTDSYSPFCTQHCLLATQFRLFGVPFLSHIGVPVAEHVLQVVSEPRAEAEPRAHAVMVFSVLAVGMLVLHVPHVEHAASVLTVPSVVQN